MQPLRNKSKSGKGNALRPFRSVVYHARRKKYTYKLLIMHFVKLWRNKNMTIKDLRKTTAPYINIKIVYGNTTIILKGGDIVTLEAFGDFLIDTIEAEDEETIKAALILQAVRI